MRELLAKDLTDPHSLQWKENRQGSIDRITAMAMVAAQGHREAALEALGSNLWGYKLPWQAERNGMQDGYSELRRERAEREKYEAYLRLACILRETKELKAFKGPSVNGKMDIDSTGWYIGAVAAIDEWVDELCRNCHGAGEMQLENGVKQTCPVCDGHRKHRYSDLERRPALDKWKAGLNEVANDIDAAIWNRLMSRAHDVIGTADRAMAHRMGRWLRVE